MSLSVARERTAATSVGPLVLFAGGSMDGMASLRISINNAILFLFYPFFIKFLNLGTYYTTVDVYNVTSSAWGTAQLSVARSALAATSVGNAAVFAGGSLGVRS